MADYVRSYPRCLSDALRPEYERAHDRAADLAAMRLLRIGMAVRLEDIVVREGLPSADFHVTTEGESWVLPALQRGVSVCWIDCLMAANKVAVFYAVFAQHEAMAAGPVSYVSFERGPAVLCGLQLERMYVDELPVALLAEPAIYGGFDHVRVYVVPTCSQSAGLPFGLGVVVAEPRGQTVSGNGDRE